MTNNFYQKTKLINTCDDFDQYFLQHTQELICVIIHTQKFITRVFTELKNVLTNFT